MKFNEAKTRLITHLQKPEPASQVGYEIERIEYDPQSDTLKIVQRRPA